MTQRASKRQVLQHTRAAIDGMITTTQAAAAARMSSVDVSLMCICGGTSGNQYFWPLTSCILRVHVECTCTCSYSVHEHVYTMLYIVDSCLFWRVGGGVLVLVRML